MADSSLSVTPGVGGNQTATTDTNLQPTGAGGLNGNQSTDFQPGISGDALTNDQGITLNPTALSTVSLSGTTSSTTVAPVSTDTAHTFNPLLIIGVLAFFVASAVMFFVTNQSSKKYNQY